MVLLRTIAIYRYGGFLEFYFKLQFSAFWSIYGKTCIEKMLILLCIPPTKTEPLPEKKITPHLLKRLEHLDKKRNSLRIILIP